MNCHDKSELNGAVVVPLATPFQEDGRPDEDGILRLLDSISQGGCQGALVLGTTGEAASLTPEDRFRIILFNDRAREFTPGFEPATPETVQHHMDRLLNERPDNGTNLYAGLNHGLKSLDSDRSSALVLVTDGVANVGRTERRDFLDLLDELKIADNTIVFYSTDNGPHMNTWPDAAMTPFRGEKNTNWEGGWRVPAMVRWPGKIKPDSVSNEIMHHMDWLPTYLAAAGVPDIKEQLLKGGVRAIGRKYKVHLDGYNFLPHLTGKVEEGPRKEIFYFADTGELTALRYEDWKAMFLEQKEYATLRAWIEPWTVLRVPLITNLRRDPYERGQITSNTYYDWLLDRAFLLVPAQTYVGSFLKTFQEYPPRMKAASFSLDKVMEQLTPSGG